MMEILLLNTGDDAKTLARQGFSGSWKLSAKRAIGCDYVVICELGKGTGVLVGKVRGLMRTNDGSRFDVHFSAVAHVNVAGIWTSKSQMPVGYVSAKSLAIDFENLDYTPV
jgi:hypothetical protein